MKVLHVIPGVSPIYGGPSRAIWTMAQGALRSGHEVHLATTTANGHAELRRPLAEPYEENGVTVFYFPRQIRSWTVSLPLHTWLRENVAEYDLVHVHALFSFPSLVACRAARRARKPYVLRPLGLLDEWSLGQKRWKKTPYYHLVERKNLRRAGAIHATSEREAEGLARLGLTDRVHVIPLAVAEPGPLPARRSEDGPLQLLFLGRLHEKKGLPTLFDAVAQLRNRGHRVRLTVAGDDPGGYRGVLQERVRELKLDGCVEFVGFVDGEAKREVLANADVFVLPSFQENFGLAAGEALAAGIPVILSDRVALAAEVDDAGAGLVVPPAAAASIARAVETLEDRQVRERMSAAARALVAERYSPERQRQALDELYASLVAADGVRAEAA